jgi:predicted XRE-type DNA-binding protein
MATSARTTRRRSTVSRAARRARAVRDTRALDTIDTTVAQLVALTLNEREMTQTEAAYTMKDAPSQISLVTTGKLRGFSTKRLLSMLQRLGFDIEVKLVEQDGQRTPRAGNVTVSVMRIDHGGDVVDPPVIAREYKRLRGL